MRPTGQRLLQITAGLVASTVLALMFYAMHRSPGSLEPIVSSTILSLLGSDGVASSASKLGNMSEERLEPLAPFPTAARPKALVVTLASGNYRQFGVELMESAAKYFCNECELTLLLMTDNTDGLPSMGGRLVPYKVPWRPWPRSTISKCTDVHAMDGLIRQQDFAIFLDADMVFLNPVSLADVWGEYVAVLHPYYPHDHRGWCGKWGGDPNTTNAHGFDANGKWTFCQYPYERNSNSKAYIPLEYGKVGPQWTSATAYYLQGALFGGTGVRFGQLCATMAANVAADDAAGITAMFHDESHLNALLLPRYNRTRILGYEFMHPPLEAAGSFVWIPKVLPRIMHRSKDMNALRAKPTTAAS